MNNKKPYSNIEHALQYKYWHALHCCRQFWHMVFSQNVHLSCVDGCEQRKQGVAVGVGELSCVLKYL